MQTLPPLAGISMQGTLGVVHMPRMWSKALLQAKGQLADGYRPG